MKPRIIVLYRTLSNKDWKKKILVNDRNLTDVIERLRKKGAEEIRYFEIHDTEIKGD